MKLSDDRVGATICVADMDRAREFYGGRLELPVENDMGEAGPTIAWMRDPDGNVIALAG